MRPRVHDSGAEASQSSAVLEGNGLCPGGAGVQDAAATSAAEEEVMEKTERSSDSGSPAEEDSDSSDSKQKRKRMKKAKKQAKKHKHKAKNDAEGKRKKKDEADGVKARLAADREALKDKSRLDAQAVQMAKQAQSEMNKKAKSAKALSAKATTAMKNPLDTISRLMGAPQFERLSSDVRDPLMKAFHTLSQMDTEAKANSSREEPHPLSFDVTDLKERIADASRTSSAANGLIKAIANATKRLSVGGDGQRPAAGV